MLSCLCVSSLVLSFILFFLTCVVVSSSSSVAQSVVTNPLLAGLLNKSVVLLVNSVGESTQRSYGVGVRCWFSFCASIHVEPCLQRIPQDWPHNFNFGFRESIILAFISHLFFEKNLRPSTISIYLASVRYFLNVSGVDVAFFVGPFSTSS